MTEQASLTVKRTGMASVLLGITRPTHAHAASLGEKGLTLQFSLQAVTVPLGEILAVESRIGRRRGTVRIQTSHRRRTVSGLPRHDAKLLLDALDCARTRWWRDELSRHANTLSSAEDRLAEFSDGSSYRGKRQLSALQAVADAATRPFSGHWPNSLKNEPGVTTLTSLREFRADPDGMRNAANSAYIENELAASKALFDGIEARPLTDEQREAVVVDEDRNLVVAAAGSGKTSVIVAKAAWLVRRRFRQPSELLLLAFAKDAQQELWERVVARVGNDESQNITVRTFHSLGMAIIGKAEGRVPSLARVAEDRGALPRFAQQTIGDLISSRGTADVFKRWFRDAFAPYKSQHEFKTYGDYWAYIRKQEIRSLAGEQVRSFEECEIANFLYLNGIAYEYERTYEHDTATTQKRQYQPDFYLTDAGIYIEHFALNASGRTPLFIDHDDYVQSMQWKRELHAEHETILVETFSHEQSAGILLSNLEAKLKARGVEFSPMAPEKTFEVLNQQQRIGPLAGLVATFLQHYKESGLSFEGLAGRAASAEDPRRAQAFLRVFRPIFERYESALSDRGEIDFQDMITRATDHVVLGRFRSPYGYILVDEFQDISPGRAALLKALLDQVENAQLFAVGDDWQAIFRFAGSDTAIMREFEERFGHSERITLETTFRCADRISEAATRFILENPTQIRKTVRSVHTAPGTCVHIGLAGEDSINLLRETLEKVSEDRRPARGQAGCSSARAVPPQSSQQPARSGQGTLQHAPFLYDRSRLERTASRLRHRPRTRLRRVRLSVRDRRRPAARTGSGRTGGSPQCRGTAVVLCRPHAREAPGLPAGRRWFSIIIHRGTDRRHLRHRCLRAAPGTGCPLSAMHAGPSRTTPEPAEPTHVLRLFQLPLLRVHATVLSGLRNGPARRRGEWVSVPELRAERQVLSRLSGLASAPDRQVRAFPGVFKLPGLPQHPKHHATRTAKSSPLIPTPGRFPGPRRAARCRASPRHLPSVATTCRAQKCHPAVTLTLARC